MSMQLIEANGGRLLEVRVSGKLAKEDYGHFLPQLERLVQQHGKISMLLEMVDFHGWTPGALWEELKADFKHFSDVQRVAIVGEKKWQKELSTWGKPFTGAEIRYFERSELPQARTWAETA